MFSGQRLRDGSCERLVLGFHGVGCPPGWVEPGERPYWCDSGRFVGILDGLCAVSEAARIPIDITFDDGNVTDATVALPGLQERGLTAAFFVCAGRIGRAGYLDDEAIRELAGAGMAIGSHGWGHVDWRRVDDKTLDLEINGSCDRLSEVIGRTVDTVAVPFGSYDVRVLRRLDKRGIRTIFTSDGGRASGNGRIVVRETYQTSWTDCTVGELASRSPSWNDRLRRSALRMRRCL